jgi:hypothetical protein
VELRMGWEKVHDATIVVPMQSALSHLGKHYVAIMGWTEQDIFVVQGAPLRRQGRITCKDESRRVYSVDSMASCRAGQAQNSRRFNSIQFIHPQTVLYSLFCLSTVMGSTSLPTHSYPRQHP